MMMMMMSMVVVGGEEEEERHVRRRRRRPTVWGMRAIVAVVGLWCAVGVELAMAQAQQRWNVQREVKRLSELTSAVDKRMHAELERMAQRTGGRVRDMRRLDTLDDDGIKLKIDTSKSEGLTEPLVDVTSNRVSAVDIGDEGIETLRILNGHVKIGDFTYDTFYTSSNGITSMTDLDNDAYCCSGGALAELPIMSVAWFWTDLNHTSPTSSSSSSSYYSGVTSDNSIVFQAVNASVVGGNHTVTAGLRITEKGRITLRISDTTQVADDEAGWRPVTYGFVANQASQGAHATEETTDPEVGVQLVFEVDGARLGTRPSGSGFTTAVAFLSAFACLLVY